MKTLKDKMRQDYQTLTKSAFGGRTPSQRLYDCCRKQLIGKRFSLSKIVHNALNLLFLSYSPTICGSNEAGSDGQVPGSAQIRLLTATSIGQR